MAAVGILRTLSASSGFDADAGSSAPPDGNGGNGGDADAGAAASRARTGAAADMTQVQQQQQDEQAAALLAALGDEAVQCPACGLVIVRDGGDDTMMCGCEARPAGGTPEKALAGGGCGHEFNFRTVFGFDTAHMP